MNGLNFNALNTAVAAIDLPFGEYWLAFTLNKGGTANDTILVWNWKDQWFALDSVAATGLGRRQFKDSLRWSDLTLPWNDPTVVNKIRWNTPAQLQAPSISIAQGGQVLQALGPPTDNGAAFPSYVTTQLWDLGQPGRKRVDRVQMTFENQSTGPMQAYLLTSETSAVAYAQTWGPYNVDITADAEGWIDCDDANAAKYFAVHLVHDLPVQWNLKDITLWARPRGTMG
jgi:hypothetical protein